MNWGKATAPDLATVRLRHLPFALLLLLLMIVVDSPAVQAQLAQADAVMHRPRPDFDPIGLYAFDDGVDHGGDFLLYPEIAVATGYSTNTFRVKEDIVADNFVEVRPRLRIVNDGDLSQFQVILDGAFRRNFNYSQNDFNDFGANLIYARVLGEDTQSNLRLGYNRRHEGRSNPNTPQDRELTLQRYDEWSGTLNITQQFDQFSVIPGAHIAYYDYLHDNGFSNDDRDYMLYRLNMQLGYNIEEGLRVFVDPYYDWRRYILKDVGRDSDGYGLNFGVLYDISAVSFVQFSAGYFKQDYLDESFQDPSGFNFNLRSIWNPTDQITVNLNGGTNIEETTVEGASSTTRYNVAGGLDYEIQDNLLFTSLIGYSADLFNGITREDQYLQGALGLVYLTNEYMAFRFTYDYDERISNDAGFEYVDHTIALNMTLQY
ncbi:outer membrane beta-barrel protein [Rhodovibrionaceae bacterium A322]